MFSSAATVRPSLPAPSQSKSDGLAVDAQGSDAQQGCQRDRSTAARGGWLHREQADLVAFLREENRALKAHGAAARLNARTLRVRSADHRLVLCSAPRRNHTQTPLRGRGVREEDASSVGGVWNRREPVSGANA